MNITTIVTRLASVAAIAAVAAAFAPAAHAQSGSLSLSNPSSCATFTGFSWTNGVLNVSCSSAPPPPPPPSCDVTAATTSFSIDTASASAFTNSSVTVVISRKGGCKGAYNVAYGTGGYASNGSLPTGWTVSPPSGVSFAEGESAKNVTVSTGTTAGLIGVWLTQGTATADGSALAVSGGEAITVTTPPATGNVPPPPAGCTTNANYVIQAVTGVQFYFGTTEADSRPPIKPGESVAASFTYNPGASWAEVDVAQVTNPAIGGTYDVEVNIDACPGNFPATTVDTPCSKRVTYPNTSDPIVYGTSSTITGICHLNPGQTYYINIRNVYKDYARGATSSCPNTNGCAIRVKPTNLY